MLQPSKNIFDGLGMRYSNKDGVFINRDGEVICFDPSIYNNCNHLLLFRKKELIEFLDSQDLTLFWTIIGEKQVIHPSSMRSESVGVMQMSGVLSLDGKGVLNIKKSDEYPETFNNLINIEDMEK